MANLSLYDLETKIQASITSLQNQINNKQDKFTENATHRWFTDTERTKLTGIETGAQVNTNVFSTFKIGTSLISATIKTDTFEFSAGNNISLVPDIANKRIIINAVTGSYSHPINHPASMITEDATHKFVTETEKSNWNAKANGLHTHEGTDITSAVENANHVAWTGITNKPTTLAGYGITDGVRTSHNHSKNQITDFSHSHIGNDITSAVPIALNSNLISGHTWDEIVAISNATPIGSIIPWAAKNLPDGWLECNGQEISRTTFSLLFEKIGTVYGTGDNVFTYNLPDLRGYFIRGWDNDRGLDAGREFGSYQNDEFKSHNHATNWRESNEYGSVDNAMGSGSTTSENSYFKLPTESTGGSETRPKNLALIFIIKAKYVTGSDPKVEGANADTLDGYHANDFILKGSPNILHGRQMFTANGFFTVPDGTSRISVLLCGGGGGGGAGSSTCKCAGKGGKAGQTLMKILQVNSGQKIPINVGQGGYPGFGAPVAPGSNGYNGGDTTFGVYARAKGGQGGGGGTPADGPENDSEIIPKAGENCPPYGIGGDVSTRDVGLDGIGFGSGGGGGWSNVGSTGYKGGFGAPGFVIVEW
jgi:microcystin-dependent protein